MKVEFIYGPPATGKSNYAATQLDGRTKIIDAADDHTIFYLKVAIDKAKKDGYHKLIIICSEYGAKKKLANKNFVNMIAEIKHFTEVSCENK